MYKLLNQHLKKYISISEEELTAFCQFFEEKQVKKKDFLLCEGEICQFEAFIVKGLGMLEGDFENGYISLGNGISHITEIRPIKEVIEDVMQDFL